MEESYAFSFLGLLSEESDTGSLGSFSWRWSPPEPLRTGPGTDQNRVIGEESAVAARYLDCLPKAGLEVLDHIRFNPDTTDFTPIFNQIERKQSSPGSAT